MNPNQEVISPNIVCDLTNSQTAYTDFKHIPALDGLRGIAVLIVMVYHLALLVPELKFAAKGGFLGVDIFFVLSGFLITSILLKEYQKAGQINLKNFYYRRFLRLIPAFWAFLIVLYFFGNYILPKNEALMIYSNYNFFFAFSYFMNWHSAANEGLTGNLNHVWSLAIEEQFYIIWSLVLYKAFAEGRGRKQIFLFTVISVIILIVWRSLRALTGTDTGVLYYSTDTRIDALLIGCAASMIYIWQLIPKEIYADRRFNLITLLAFFISLWILFSFSHTDFLLYYGILSVFAICIAIIILWLITRENCLMKSILEFKPLRWIGHISYGLYLWHYAFYEFAKKNFESVYWQVTVGIALAFAVSAVSFYLIEKPFLKIKDILHNA